MFSCNFCKKDDHSPAEVVEASLSPPANEDEIVKEPADVAESAAADELAEAKDKEEQGEQAGAAETEQKQQQQPKEEEGEEAAQAKPEDAEAQKPAETDAKLEETKVEEKQGEEKKQGEVEQKAEADPKSKKLDEFLRSKGYGQDVNAKRKTFRKFFYPLHDAVIGGDVELIQELLAAKADPTLKSSSGKTPLQRAERLNTDGSRNEMCKVLAAAAPSTATPEAN